MNCSRCPQASASTLKHLGPLCKGCFCDLIERRARKELRQKCPLRPKDRIALRNDKGLESVVVEAIVRSVASEIPCELLILDDNKRSPSDVRLLVSISATTLAAGLLKEILGQGRADVPTEGIAVFESLTNEEMLTFAMFKNLKFEQKTPSEIDRMLKMIDERYENSTFGLVKSKKVLDGVSTSPSHDSRHR